MQCSVKAAVRCWSCRQSTFPVIWHSSGTLRVIFCGSHGYCIRTGICTANTWCFLWHPFRHQLEDGHAGPQPPGIHTGINNTDTQCSLQQVSESRVHWLCQEQHFKEKLQHFKTVLILAPFPIPHPMSLALSRWVWSPVCHPRWLLLSATLFIHPTLWPTQMQPLMLAPPLLHTLCHHWRKWHYSRWHGEATKWQIGAVTLFSLLLGRRKSSLLWRALQPTAAELIYGSRPPYEEAPSPTFHHPAPLPWGMERSSSSGKMGLSLLFLITSTTKWTSSKVTELLFHPVSLFPPGRVPPQLISSLPLLFWQEALFGVFF